MILNGFVDETNSEQSVSSGLGGGTGNGGGFILDTASKQKAN